MPRIFIPALILGLVLIAQRVTGRDFPGLTREEKAWIASNPVITLSAMHGYAPLSLYDDESGEIVGGGVDIVRTAAERVGLDARFVGGDWKDLLQMAWDGEVDGVINSMFVGERLQRLLFTRPYFSSPPAVMAAGKASSLQNMSDLNGLRVAAISGSSHVDYLRESARDVRVVGVNSTEEIFKSVLEGRADAGVHDSVQLRYFSDRLISPGYGTVFLCDNEELNRYRVAISREKPLLRSILDKGLASLEPETLADIYNRWGLSPFNTPIIRAYCPERGGEGLA